MIEYQRNFIENEIWTLTFGAAFQRVGVYMNPVNEGSKKAFKKGIKKFIEVSLLPKYQKPNNITDDEHVKNIYSISDFSTQYSTILNNGRLNFGVCQKLLNLLLKYYWCLFNCPTPPHFPIDRRIQDSLIVLAKKQNIKPIEIVSWTRMKNEVDYVLIIKFIRNNFLENQSLAQFELEHFERRRNQL